MEKCCFIRVHQVARVDLPFCVSTHICAIHRAMLRFILLRITRRPLLSPPIPEREFDPTTLTPSSHESSPTLAPSSPSSSPPATPDHLRNNHSTLPPHSLLMGSPQMHVDTSVQDYLLSKAMTTSSVKLPVSLIQTLSSPQDWLGEIIYILRPLVYGMGQDVLKIVWD
jgi:peroxin-16